MIPPVPPTGSQVETPQDAVSPLRIQVLLNAFAMDGPGRLVAGLVREWIKVEGVHVRVAALTRGGPLQRTLHELGIPTDTVSARFPRLLKTARSWAGSVGQSDPPDILHTHLARPDLVGPSLLSSLRCPKIVSTNHGLHAWWEKGKIPGFVYSQLFRFRQNRYDRIVAVSRAVRDDLIDAGIHPERVNIIHNGIDTGAFRPLSTSQKREFRKLIGLDPLDGFLILLVGNLIPLKGHEFFLRALPSILQSHPNVRVLMIGEGTHRERLNELIRELNLEDRIKRISPLTVLLPKVMGAADLLVHPSLSESFGLVVAEAQAAGLPVIATRIGGPAEIILDGETGYLVPQGDSGSITASVDRLFSNPEIMKEMGVAGRQRVLQLYDIRRCAADYLMLFRSLVRNTAPHNTHPELTRE